MKNISKTALRNFNETEGSINTENLSLRFAYTHTTVNPIHVWLPPCPQLSNMKVWKYFLRRQFVAKRFGHNLQFQKQSSEKHMRALKLSVRTENSVISIWRWSWTKQTTRSCLQKYTLRQNKRYLGHFYSQALNAALFMPGCVSVTQIYILLHISWIQRGCATSYLPTTCGLYVLSHNTEKHLEQGIHETVLLTTICRS